MRGINYDELPVLLKPKELGEVLKIDMNLVYRIIKRSDFPILRISKRHVRIPKVLLIKWIKKNKEYLREHINSKEIIHKSV